MHHTALAAYPGVAGVLKSQRKVEYYYLAVLKRDAAGVACRPFGDGYPAPTVPPPDMPHRPWQVTWEGLWGACCDG